VDMFANEEADANVVLEATEAWTGQAEVVVSKVGDALSGCKVDAILCVAGGWAGGNAASKDLVKNCDLMWKQSVWTSVIAASLAAKYMNEGGALVLTGAQPALQGTPGMMGYGMAKAAVHQLVSSLAGNKSGLPTESYVAAILPVTLDTPMNRKFMPGADFTSWTPLETVAQKLFSWSTKEERPASGSLVQVITKDNSTEFTPTQ